MPQAERFNRHELEALAAWAREPRHVRYRELEAKGLSETQVRFMQWQIRCIYEDGNWNGAHRPTEVEDLLTDLRMRGLL
jgi:cytochrome P450